MLNKYLRYVRLSVPHASSCPRAGRSRKKVCDCGANDAELAFDGIFRDAEGLGSHAVFRVLQDYVPWFLPEYHTSYQALYCLSYLSSSTSPCDKDALRDFISIAVTNPDILFRATYALVCQRSYISLHPLLES